MVELRHKGKPGATTTKAQLATVRLKRADCNKPLISISLAQGAARSPATSCASSLWSLRSQVVEHLDDDGRLEYAGGTPMQSASCAPDGEQPHHKSKLTTPSGLESVERDYVRLINYNKLQLFHLGALLYALLAALQLAPGTSWPPDEVKVDGHNVSTVDCVPLQASGSAGAFAMLALVGLLLAAILLKLVQFHRSMAENLNGESSNRNDDQEDACPPLSARWRLDRPLVSRPAELVGLGASVALLSLPIALIYAHFYLDDERAHCEHLEAPIVVPSSLLCVLVYTMPLILGQISAPSERPPVGYATACHLAYGALVLAPTLICLLAATISEQHLIIDSMDENWTAAGGAQLRVASLALGIAALAGQLRRRQLAKLAGSRIFKGANELIEAKVSLEQQRQQQETLLLSVLPAYVAEQVKRNMVKKIEDGAQEQQQQQQPVPSGSGGGGGGGMQQSSQPQHLLVVTCNSAGNSVSSHQLAHQARSLTLSSEGQEARATSSAATRHSLGKFARLSTSLASGAAYLSTSAARSNGPSGRPATGSEPQAVIVSTSGGSGQSASLSSLAGHQHHLAAAGGNSPLAMHPHSLLASGHATASLQQQQSRRGFNELYIRTYNNVSLLYGDIVGFTSLCTQLSSSQLVRVLNNLFSHFDHLADRHKIMRIKILGDCYYGVSGIPEFAVMGTKHHAAKKTSAIQAHHQCPKTGPTSQHEISATTNHAINCVNMGLDMINHIKCLNIEREQAGTSQGPLPAHFELNMRIGIHTGHIHSGVIGLKKWQFDVWSNDVSIAMHCESSGVAGRVQVTEATAQHLQGAFALENAPSTVGSTNTRDSYLADKNIRTYLIKERTIEPLQQQQQQQQQPAPSELAEKQVERPAGSSLDRPRQRQRKRTTRLSKELQNGEHRIRAATIGTIRQTLLAGELVGGAGPLNALALVSARHQDLSWCSMTFRDGHQEAQYGLDEDLRLTQPMRELIQLACLLILAPQFLNRLLLPHALMGDDHDGANGLQRGLQLSLLLGVVLPSLILVMLVWRCLAHSHHAGTATNQNSKSCDLADFLRDEAALSEQQQVTRQTSRECILNKSEICARFVQKLACDNRLVKWLAGRQVARKSLHEGVAGWLAALLVVCMATSQLQLLACAQCAAATSTQLQTQLVQLRQLSAFLLLAALDLSGTVLKYKLKLIVILALLIVQLVLLLSTWAPPKLHSFLFVSLQLHFCSHQTDTLKRGPFELTVEQLSDALLLVLSLWSWAYARKLEYSHRCNFLWRNRLSVDHEELEYISGINKVLLENILPSHVVHHYLSTTAASGKRARWQPDECLQTTQQSRLMRMSLGQFERDQLYHEQHDSVAVMFASIPHFYEFYDESDISKQGLGCIALLNEIICDFDKLLLKNKFSRIEKIKTIGSTYMAAAGLRPSGVGCHVPLSLRNSASSSASHQMGAPMAGNISTALGNEPDSCDALRFPQQRMNLICMIQFATSLMSALNGINKQSFQVFKLRVGVNAGPVIAGIIGAQRPFYDIWGDCVNIASRMESLGEIGRIQVEERTAKLLLECLCTETYAIVKRGHIDVKGKGGMVTYFVDKKSAPPDQQQQVRHQISQQQQQQTMTTPAEGQQIATSDAHQLVALSSSHGSLASCRPSAVGAH